MNAAAYFFAFASLAAWLAFAISRRRHARAIGALLCQHKRELTLASVRGKQAGLKAANGIHNRGNAVADQPRAGVSCAGREVSVSAPHYTREQKERREPEPVTSGPNSGICILDCDSPSYPPSDDERRQCGCVTCLADLEKAANERAKATR